MDVGKGKERSILKSAEYTLWSRPSRRGWGGSRYKILGHGGLEEVQGGAAEQGRH